STTCTWALITPAFPGMRLATVLANMPLPFGEDVSLTSRERSHSQRDDMITAAQIRRARELLEWPASKLGQKVGLRALTIRRAETTDGEALITVGQKAAIQRALEAAGIEFTNGDQPGVKLRAGDRE